MDYKQFQTFMEQWIAENGGRYTSAHSGGAIDAAITAVKNKEAVWDKAPRTARVIVGTSTAGWTEADCDFLCDGTADNVEIVAAISALPDTGGTIVVLSGTYHIASELAVRKAGVEIVGSGLPIFSLEGYAQSFVSITVSDCTLKGIQFALNTDAVSFPRAVTMRDAADRTRLENLVIDGFAEGISTFGSTSSSAGLSDVIIRGCRITGNGFGGNSNNAAIGCFLNSGTICGNYIDGDFYIGIGQTSSDNAVPSLVTSNVVMNFSGYGIVTNGPCMFLNNYVEGGAGIGLRLVGKCFAVGNYVKDCDTGIVIDDNNVFFSLVVGNVVMRGSGAASDYSDSQGSINIIRGRGHVVVANSVLGKDVTAVNMDTQLIANNLI